MKTLNVEQVEQVSGGWFMSTSPSAPGSGTLGPGGGSDPGNSDPAGVLPNRQDSTTVLTMAMLGAASSNALSGPIRWAMAVGAYFANRN